MSERNGGLGMWLIVSLAASAGCSQATLYGRDFMPDRQGQIAVDKGVGKIPADLGPSVKKVRAANGGIPIQFLGIHDGQICFGFTSDSQLIGPIEEAKARRKAAVAKQVWVFEAKGSLNELGPEWPKTKPPTQIQSVQLLDAGVNTTYEEGAAHTEENYKYSDLVTPIEVCGPAPAITPQTHYVLLTKYNDAFTAPSLYVWELEGTPTAGSDAKATPSQDTPVATAAPVTAAGPFAKGAGKQDLIATITATGRCSLFLNALKAAKMTERVRDGGPYTVFAPTDEAWKAMGDGDALLKDKERLALVLGFHIAAKPFTLDQMKKRSAMISTINDLNFQIVDRGGTLAIGRTAHAAKNELDAKNGSVFLVDTVMTP